MMKHGQVEEAVPRSISVCLSYCVVSEVSVPDPERRGRQVCGKFRKDALRMEGCGHPGDERPRGSCTSGGKQSAESIDIRVDGDTEREDSDQIVQKLSSDEEETLLGKSLLEQGLLREHDRPG